MRVHHHYRGCKGLPDNLERVPCIHDVLERIGKEACEEQYQFKPSRAGMTEEVRLTHACPWVPSGRRMSRRRGSKLPGCCIAT
jgi:hypothetical protein